MAKNKPTSSPQTATDPVAETSEPKDYRSSCRESRLNFEKRFMMATLIKIDSPEVDEVLTDADVGELVKRASRVVDKIFERYPDTGADSPFGW